MDQQVTTEFSHDRLELRRDFSDFLQQDFEFKEGTYAARIDNLGESTSKKGYLLKRRLVVDVGDLRQYSDGSLLQKLITKPSEAIPAFEEAIKEYARMETPNDDLKAEMQKNDELFVGFNGYFGAQELGPRQLLSRYLGKLVKVQGIVTKCSLVRPKVARSVHYCEVTKSTLIREYRDVTSLAGLPTPSAYPVQDESGNPYLTEYGRCKYRNNQSVTIQELPELAPPGQLPHGCDIILENDLVDSCKPGDRVNIVGVFKALGGNASGQTSGVFKSIIIGVHIEKLSRVAEREITDADVLFFSRMRSRHPDLLALLARSLAPSIYGHDIIKRGLVLQLMGGLEKNLQNGTHLRGDINCLLVGDPGVAKSQLLRAVMNVAPHAVSTTGKGSSGVGLTAAVTTDRETGEKRLEAGAMVLADRGVVCIDEFDKMTDGDRVAIHEVMEQQTVTIAKAGIQASLNARCSVLAAANPLYGTYDKDSTITRNVNLPDSLLSRFDLLFVVLDQMDEHKDREVALHVLKQHRYRAPGEDPRGRVHIRSVHDADEEPTPPRVGQQANGADSDDEEDSYGYLKLQQYDPSRPLRDQQVLHPDMLRKYILYTRSRFNLSNLEMLEEASEAAASYYVELRQNSGDSALPVTARTLETIVRLATAAAKVRNEGEIAACDVETAKALLNHVLRTSVDEEETRPRTPPPSAGKRKRPARRDDDEESDDIDDDDDDDDRTRQTRGAAAATASGAKASRKAARTGGAAVEDGAGPSASAPPASGDGVNGRAPEDVWADLSDANKRLVIKVIDELTSAAQSVDETAGVELREVQETLAARGLRVSEAQVDAYATHMDRSWGKHDPGMPLPQIIRSADAVTGNVVIILI